MGTMAETVRRRMFGNWYMLIGVIATCLLLAISLVAMYGIGPEGLRWMWDAIVHGKVGS
jgi:hypothetical protein